LVQRFQDPQFPVIVFRISSYHLTGRGWGKSREARDRWPFSATC
jgi:hypothetical protein